MKLFSSVKVGLRDALPSALQVPIKYFWNKCNGILEPELVLLPLLVSNEERAIDIGANRGTYSYELWKIGARVTAFEPNPACYQVLAAWASRKASIDVHAVALSSAAGEAVLNIPIDEHGLTHEASASLIQGHSRAGLAVSVPMSMLDHFGFSNVDFIKIDVEGHEFEVLRGAKGTLESSFPSVLIEIEQRHNLMPIETIFNDFESLGYQGYYFQNHTLLPLSSFNKVKDQSLENFGKAGSRYINNFLFLHEMHIRADRYASLFARFLT